MKALIATIAVVMSAIVSALEPEDVKGVIADTIVSGIDQCWSLCDNNDNCRYAIYDPPCHECWQMDCISRGVQGYDYTKPGVKDTYYCKSIDQNPTMPQGCSNLTATATDSNGDQASQTSSLATESAKSVARKVFADWLLATIMSALALCLRL